MTSRIRPTRRRFLAGASAAALTPMLVFRASARAGPRELALMEVAPNPDGVIERAFLLTGDPLAGPIERILAADGAPVPAPTLPEGERRVLRILHINDMPISAILAPSRPKPASASTGGFAWPEARI